jgi:LacI family transcriptional regulator
MRNLGHRQIAFVTSRQLDASFKDRLNGYICALHHSGIDVDPGMVCVVDEPEMTSSIDATVAQIVAFLESFRERDRPTAVVAVNDAHALAVLYACRRIGIPVPHQMSIIGFDDTEFSAHTFPALTTMRVDKENMGRIAVRQLWKRLCASVGEGQVEPPISIELAVTLIERGSCAAPVTGFTDSTGGRPRRHGVERAPLLSAGKPSRQVAVGA